MKRAISRLAFSLAGLAAVAPPAAAGDDLPVPRGSRPDGAAIVSSQGFGPTGQYVDKELARRGIAHHRIGPYRAHGVDVTRFLVEDTRAPWSAVHIYRAHGKTWISFVKRSS